MLENEDLRRDLKHAYHIGVPIGLALMFISLTVSLSRKEFDTYVFWGSVSLGLFAVFVTAAVVYTVKQIEKWDMTPVQRENTTEAPPPLPAAPPKREKSSVVEMATQGESMYRFGNKFRRVPEDVSVDDLDLVVDAYQSNRLPSVSQRALHAIGISRFKTAAPNADSTIRFLEECGFINGSGEWTDAARQVLPHSPV